METSGKLFEADKHAAASRIGGVFGWGLLCTETLHAGTQYMGICIMEVMSILSIS